LKACLIGIQNGEWCLAVIFVGHFVIGHGLGMYPSLIQSYEFIGVEGGSLFILLVNVGVFYLIRDRIRSKNGRTSILFLSIAISLFFAFIAFQ
jgi:apolipoprotein N-acyltransferase